MARFRDFASPSCFFPPFLSRHHDGWEILINDSPSLSSIGRPAEVNGAQKSRSHSVVGVSRLITPRRSLTTGWKLAWSHFRGRGNFRLERNFFSRKVKRVPRERLWTLWKEVRRRDFFEERRFSLNIPLYSEICILCEIRRERDLRDVSMTRY